MNRSTLAGLGVLVAACGIGLLLVPGLAASLATGTSVLYAMALVSFLYGLSVADDRARAEVEGHDLEERETVQELPPVGTEFREEMELVRARSSFESQQLHQSITEDLQRIAVEVVSRREGCSERRARELLERGAWTDDPIAAEFFSKSGLRMSTAELLSEMVGRRTSFSEKVDRVVDELVAQWESTAATDHAAPDDETTTAPTAADGGEWP